VAQASVQSPIPQKKKNEKKRKKKEKKRKCLIM
jgi:hypothetical protein